MFKKSLIFFAIVTVFSCASKSSSSKNPSALNVDVDFTVFNTNDVHGNAFYDENNKVGFAKEKALIDQAKAQGLNVLVLDDGDIISGGDVFATIDKGKSMIDIYNEMGIDAITAGNHEFDYGKDWLMELKKGMQFPIVSANILVDDKPMFEPYIIKQVGNAKVGIIGIETPETAVKTNPLGIQGVKFLSPKDDFVLNKIKELDKKTDFIIVLAHLGVEGDWSSKMLYDIPGINLIIDGHSHTEMQEQVDEDTYIIQTGSMFKNLGRVDISVSGGKVSFKSKLISPQDVKDIEPDAKIENIIQSKLKTQQEIRNKEITKTSTNWNGERNDIRTKPTNLGEAVAMSLKLSTDSDVAIVNAGGIRTSIPAGPVTMGQAISVLPFGNLVKVIEISGQDIVKALEYGYSKFPEPAGSFSQTAGLKFDFDETASVGNRISNVSIMDKFDPIKFSPIENSKIYTLATNDFMTNGGDGYDMFVGKKIIKENLTMLDVFIEYLRSLSV